MEADSLSARDDAARREFWACLALRECSGIGARRLAALLTYFGSAYNAVCAVDEWKDAGIPSPCGSEFRRENWRAKALLEWAAAKVSPCGILLWTDPDYPALLRSTADAPPFLYFTGDISLLRNPAVAVVGMRSCSEEGLKATVAICNGLTEAGVTIVSGMARGIDRAAHLAGLEGVGGSIGVLGGGIDHIYPKQNTDLYDLMRRKGLLLSEQPPGKVPDENSFPVRNRIISGLSLAVVVVEAATRSGSLNTARHALEQNRELMAVPGAVTAASARGCQELIRRGAKAVFCADDVLREIVPHLREHIREEVLARDLERFRIHGPEGGTRAGKKTTADFSLRKGTLPWRADDGKKQKSRDAAARHIPQEPCAEQVKVAPLPAAQSGLTGLEAQVYDCVRQSPSHVDDICRALGQDAGVVSRTLAMLEVRGRVTRMPGMVYVGR